jgi:hypothetical protein
MKKALKKTNDTSYWGDLSNITGDLSCISGDLSCISGDLSGIRGNLYDCEITPEERANGIDINDLIG